MFAAIVGFLSAISGGFAAYYWIRSTTQVVLTETPGGFGSMLGGEIVVRGTNDERLNFNETYVVQANLSNLAARWSAATAVLSGLAALLGGFHV